MDSELLSLNQIVRDGGTQSRAEMDTDTISEYRDVIDQERRQNPGKGAWPFPPIEVYYDGEKYHLADGFHRVAAAAMAGVYRIPAIIHQGTRRDAVLASVGANATHGLRRTNDDKRRAVQTLLRDEEWQQWSDREIARRCHVSHPTVAAIRAEMVSTGKITSTDERKYVHPNGAETSMKTANIGKPADAPVIQQPAVADGRWVDSQTPLLPNERIGHITAHVRKNMHHDALKLRPDNPIEIVREWADVGPEHPNWPFFGTHPLSEVRQRHVADNLRGLLDYGIVGTGAVAWVDGVAWCDASSNESVILSLADEGDSMHKYRITFLLQESAWTREEIIAAAKTVRRERQIPYAADKTNQITVTDNREVFAAVKQLRSRGFEIDHAGHAENPDADHDDLRVWRVSGLGVLSKNDLWRMVDNNEQPQPVARMVLHGDNGQAITRDLVPAPPAPSLDTEANRYNGYQRQTFVNEHGHTETRWVQVVRPGDSQELAMLRQASDIVYKLIGSLPIVHLETTNKLAQAGLLLGDAIRLYEKALPRREEMADQ